MEGTWNQAKKKYVKKEKEKKDVVWVHKNNYHVDKLGRVYRGVNKPYVKPKENTSESKD